MGKKERLAVVKLALASTMPVLVGFMMFGIAFGILMSKSGYSVWFITLMSAVCFCGSMQFASVPLFTAPFNPFAAFLMSIMVNARHVFYGVAMLD